MVCLSYSALKTQLYVLTMQPSTSSWSNSSVICRIIALFTIWSPHHAFIYRAKQAARYAAILIAKNTMQIEVSLVSSKRVRTRPNPYLRRPTPKQPSIRLRRSCSIFLCFFSAANNSRFSERTCGRRPNFLPEKRIPNDFKYDRFSRLP